jgi:3-hydroxybutyryl-CoA dehydratase
MGMRSLTFAEITVGDTFSFEKSWSKEDVLRFSKLSGDENPLHVDESYAATTSFGKCLVHGMLVASSCSELVGMYLPGKYCLFLKQIVSFKHPVFIDDALQVKGTVIFKSEATNIIRISILITKNTVTVLEGESMVQLLQ